GGRGDEARISPHEADHGDAPREIVRLDVPARDGANALLDRRLEPESSLDPGGVVVVRLGNADHGDVPADLPRRVDDRASPRHRPFAPDGEEHIDLERAQTIGELPGFIRPTRGFEDRSAAPVDLAHRLEIELERRMLLALDEPAVTISNPPDPPHPVPVPQELGDAADHVVQARAEPSTRHDRAARRLGPKVEQLPRSGRLEGRQLALRKRCKLRPQAEGAHRFVVRSEDGLERRRNSRLAQLLDDEILGPIARFHSFLDPVVPLTTVCSRWLVSELAASAAQDVSKLPPRGDIPFDLRDELSHVRETSLFPMASRHEDLEVLAIEVAVEIEEMRLDAIPRRIEGPRAFLAEGIVATQRRRASYIDHGRVDLGILARRRQAGKTIRRSSEPEDIGEIDPARKD